MSSLFHIIIIAIIFSTLNFVHSRTLTETTSTTTLDVTASLQKTQSVFSSYNPKAKSQAFNQQKQKQKQTQSLSSLTLELHTRTSILSRPTHTDYKSLTIARLERDSARLKSLTTRLHLALTGILQSDLEPSGGRGQEQQQDLQGPIISGTSQGSGEYFCRVAIGRPPTPAYMVLDTGSDVNWLQCAPCADCYQQADPIFEPASSASYSPLSCETKQCKSLDVSECRNNTCLYEVAYSDGSYTVGEFVTETLTLGSASVNNVAIGCGHNNEGLFIGAAGLLGLGGGKLSLPSQLNATSFSYCLVDRDSDSASTLEFNSPLPPNAVTAPLHRNPKLDTFYYVGVSGLSVGGESLRIPESAFEVDSGGNGGIIIDSGTAVSRLQTETYNSLRDAFVKGTRKLGLASTNGVALFDTCYDLSSKTSVEVPTVAFHFPNGKVLALAAKNVLIPVDSTGTFCLAFAPTSSAFSIIGNVQQQQTRVAFDLANSLIGFSSTKC